MTSSGRSAALPQLYHLEGLTATAAKLVDVLQLRATCGVADALDGIRGAAERAELSQVSHM